MLRIILPVRIVTTMFFFHGDGGEIWMTCVCHVKIFVRKVVERHDLIVDDLISPFLEKLAKEWDLRSLYEVYQYYQFHTFLTLKSKWTEALKSFWPTLILLRQNLHIILMT